MNNGVVFEKQVLELLRKMGFDAEMTKTSGDGGIDIIAHKHDDIVGGKYIIQCKNWANPVGEPPIRDLFGVVVAENANKGILITQSSFTAQALEFAKGKHLELINGEKLSQLFNKYGLIGFSEDDSSRVNQDELLINDLKLQLSKSPQNIIILKALGDFFLLHGKYEEAIDYFKRILPLKPEIQTKLLQSTYLYGLHNYAVALALLKKYDEAISIYKKINEEQLGVTELNEANLYHYLGLFDLAKQAYEKVKSYSSSSLVDEWYEQAYMKTFIKYPYLSMRYLDDNRELKGALIPLDTPEKKAAEELSQLGLDLSFGNQIFEPINQIMAAWEKLKNIELKTDYSKIYTSPSIDELNQIANDWAQVISEYRSKLESEPEGEYSHIKREMINVLIAVVEDFLGNLSKLTDYLSSIQNYDENLWKTLSSSGLPVSGSLLTGAGLLEKFSGLLKDYNEISVNTIKKWEDSFEKERLYWQEKITVKAIRVNIKGPDDPKKLYMAAKEFHKDIGVDFGKAKEFLVEGYHKRFENIDEAYKFIDKYKKLECTVKMVKLKD